MARAKNGEAIGPRGRSPSGRKELRRLIRTALKGNDLDVWRRARAVLGYIEGRRVVDLAVTRGSVNRGLGWYDTLGVEGLLTGKPPGPSPRLGGAQRAELTALIEQGPAAAGHYQFAPVFNAQTFWTFLRLLVHRSRRKISLIIDNGSCHNLNADGNAWLAANRRRLELFRLPAYSPEFTPIEGLWTQTKKRTTHNTFFRTTDERDAALTATFSTFRARPSLIAAQVARFV